MANQFRIRVDATEERLERVGPLIRGSWSRHDDALGRRMAGEFLLDTGTYGAMIDCLAAEVLQLTRRGMREIHGIHGYGSLPQYLARLTLPAKDVDDKDCFFEQIIECVAVPSLTEKSHQDGAELIGILGRAFLRSSRLEIDGRTGRIGLIIQP